MFLHDHEKKDQPMYCTLMKEICHSGWTKSMGEVNTPDGATIRPRCHKWVSVFINDKKADQIREIFDCNERWGTDLTQQVAQEVYQNAAATESVRNHVAENTGVAKIVQSFFVQLAEAAGHKLTINKSAEALPAPNKNGKGEA